MNGAAGDDRFGAIRSEHMSHNTFGHLFRVTTWGESHGPALGCVVDGCPPGMRFKLEDIQAWLDKRKPGQSRFVTQRREADLVKVLSGVMVDADGETMITTGTPISMLIENVDQRSKDYGEIARQYRPGHADYTYDVKYGIRDYRGGGRSSARETAARVAAGGIARMVVPGVTVRGALVQIGQHKINRANWDWDRGRRRTRSSRPTPRSCRSGKSISTASARPAPRSAPSIEVVAEGVPAGLGAPIYGKLDQDIASLLMSINAVKGVEIGNGFDAADITGEENADEMRMGNDGKPDVPVQQCRRYSRRHLDRPAGRRALRGQADLVDPRPSAARSTADGNERRGLAPRAATTPASASAPCRSARPWLPAPLPTTICVDRGQTGRLEPILRQRLPCPCLTIRSASWKPIRAFERGEIVVVMDDDDRENEGDLIVAAVHCTPEKMAFIVRHTSGIVCTPLPREDAKRLNLDADGRRQRLRRTRRPSPSRSTSSTARPPASRPRTAR